MVGVWEALARRHTGTGGTATSDTMYGAKDLSVTDPRAKENYFTAWDG